MVVLQRQQPRSQCSGPTDVCVSQPHMFPIVMDKDDPQLLSLVAEQVAARPARASPIARSLGCDSSALLRSLHDAGFVDPTPRSPARPTLRRRRPPSLRADVGCGLPRFHFDSIRSNALPAPPSPPMRKLGPLRRLPSSKSLPTLHPLAVAPANAPSPWSRLKKTLPSRPTAPSTTATPAGLDPCSKATSHTASIESSLESTPQASRVYSRRESVETTPAPTPPRMRRPSPPASPRQKPAPEASPLVLSDTRPPPRPHLNIHHLRPKTSPRGRVHAVPPLLRASRVAPPVC